MDEALVKPDAKSSWTKTLEKVTQFSIKELSELRSTKVREIEAVVFANNLVKLAYNQKDESGNDIRELSLFSNPVGLFSFQVRNRRYVEIDYRHIGLTEKFKEGHDFQKILEKEKENIRMVLRRLTQTLSRKVMDLKDYPTSFELLAILVDHLRDIYMQESTAHSVDELSDEGGYRFFVDEVHSSRRGAIQNWQARLEKFSYKTFGHDEETRTFYAYPYVDLFVPEGKTLVMVMVSPLDVNFVDEKVTADHRAAEVTFALFDLGSVLYPGGVAALVPLINQTFARVLFTSMLDEATEALTASFEEHATISRYWFNMASDGLKGIIGEDQKKNHFDAFQFCDAIVHKVMCAKVPGVRNTEIYPFDRVFIFRESGTSSMITDEPIEVTVLESSILSNNPADRARYLTRRERVLRGTEDFECDPSRKRINEDDVFQFYIHRFDGKLYLSCQSKINEENLVDGRSIHARDADRAAYLISNHDYVEGSNISDALYNLLGRLDGNCRSKKTIESPLDRTRVVDTVTFNEDFEKRRQEVLQRADDSGLSYYYEHGVSLDTEIHLLSELQTAYNTYLDDKFKDQDERFLRDRYRQDNLSKDDVDRLLSEHKEKWNQERTRSLKDPATSALKQLNSKTGKQRAKVVYVSFSWDLHDENMRMSQARSDGQDNIVGRDKTDETSDDIETNAILANQYAFTMVLVADSDPEKSIAKLQAEREDLKTFFQILMRQIWMDRKSEYEYLEKKSRSIVNSLGQFSHRVKYLLSSLDSKYEAEVDDLHKSLKELIRPTRNPVRKIEISGTDQIFAMLTGLPQPQVIDSQDFQTTLFNIAKSYNLKTDDEFLKDFIQVIPSSLPRLIVQWSDIIIRDAFSVMLKNACEAALGNPNKHIRPFVTVQLQAGPIERKNGHALWFMDIVVENSGGPIGPRLLSQLNTEEPIMVVKSDRKDGSSGMGVFLSRYQLQNIIGSPADITIQDTANGVVQSRMRIPAECPTENFEIQPAFRNENALSTGDYLLYVEDEPEIYKKVVGTLNRHAAESGVEMIHLRSYQAASDLIRLKAPLILLTDLMILKGNGTLCGTKYGYDLIRTLMESTLDSRITYQPPIWIFTGEKESEVIEGLGDVSQFNYRFKPHSQKLLREVGKPGTICIFDKKLPTEITGLPDLMKQVISTCQMNMDHDPMKGMKSLAISRKQPWTQLAFEEDGLGDPLVQAVNHSGTEHKPIVIVTAHCATIGDIARVLSRWFMHDGIPDPDVHSKRLCRLYDHVNHQRLVLSISLEKSMSGRLPVWLKYWGLSQNLWFSDSGGDTGSVALAWSMVHNERKGPLSVLRHDSKNKLMGPALSVLLDGVIGAIDQAETALIDKGKHLLDIEKTLISGGDLSDILEKVVLNVKINRKSLITQHQYTDTKLRELDQILLNCSETDNSLVEWVKTRREILFIIMSYLGVNI